MASCNASDTTFWIGFSWNFRSHNTPVTSKLLDCERLAMRSDKFVYIPATELIKLRLLFYNSSIIFVSMHFLYSFNKELINLKNTILLQRKVESRI